MILHIDGSKHRWLQDDRWHDLIVILDDATSAVNYAQRVKEDELPALLNVVDTGEERTGLIVQQTGEDSTALKLLKYRDGAGMSKMPHLQEIASGE